MSTMIQEVLDFVEENDVKFVRLMFCDVLGEIHNISIMSSQLMRAFSDGIGFDASSVAGFLNVEDSDLFLYPDPSTMSVLPWRPQQGRVIRFYCDIKRADGTRFEGDTRYILKKATEELFQMGLTCKVGPECEFYLMYTDDDGGPTLKTHDKGSYFAVAPQDKGENIRREICLTLEEMGIMPESSHHECGPGQHEVVFCYDSALQSADNLVTFQNVVRTTAQRNGLYASFMPKPFADQSGNGLHINISLNKNGRNLFDTTSGEDLEITKSFTAGILHFVPQITAILNPTVNSYKRFGQFEAPSYVSWSHANRSQLLRIPSERGEYSRLELRSADPYANPYLAFALLMKAGIYGILNKLPIPQAESVGESLPKGLDEALSLLKRSELAQEVLGDLVYHKFIAIKERECEAYFNSIKDGDITDFEIKHYL